jgi:hypothetical protein
VAPGTGPQLLSSLLRGRGYPAAGFEQSAEDVSVHDPRMMERYRSGCGVAVRPGKALAGSGELRGGNCAQRWWVARVGRNSSFGS